MRAVWLSYVALLLLGSSIVGCGPEAPPTHRPATDVPVPTTAPVTSLGGVATATERALPTKAPTPAPTQAPTERPLPTETPALASTQTPTPSPTTLVVVYRPAFGIDYTRPEQYLAQGEQSRISDSSVLDPLRTGAQSLDHLGDIYRWLKREFTAYAAGGKTIGLYLLTAVEDSP